VQVVSAQWDLKNNEILFPFTYSQICVSHSQSLPHEIERQNPSLQFEDQQEK